MNVKITVFTPTYNRAHTLDRVYNSLCVQTIKEFEWLVIDDGSTDDTEMVIDKFIKESDFTIRYIKQENQNKFLTVFKGASLAKGEFFTILDSDDKIDSDALQKLLQYWSKVPDRAVFLSVLCKDKAGKVIGDRFPKDGLSTTIFDMRYRYRVKGDKWGMTKTALYKKFPVDTETLKGKGFIPEGVYQFYFDQLGTHFCINEALLTYMGDTLDETSLANSYYSEKNAFGLAENYKTFINVYSNKKWKYPGVLFRNVMGYLIYSAKDHRSYWETVNGTSDMIFKSFATVVYLFRPILKRC